MLEKLDRQARLNLEERCKADPLYFIREVLGSDNLWVKQEEIARSVRDNQRTAVKACFASGKTFVAANIALWYLFSFIDSIVISTAPTWTQVENILWGEIRRLYNRSKIPLGGNLLQTMIKCSEMHYAMGLSTDEVEKFQGFHSHKGKVLIVVDEAPGVDDKMYEAFEGLLTSDKTRLLLIGNPNAQYNKFYEAFKSTLYNKMTISAFDTPNVMEGREVIPGLVTKKWVEERRIEWGEDSPMWQSKVLGEFPKEGDDVLIPLYLCEQAESKDIELTGSEPKILSLDIARMGHNETVWCMRQGNKVLSCSFSNNGLKTTEIVGKTLLVCRDFEPDTIVVDDIGVGGGVTDMLGEHFNCVYDFNACKQAEPSDDLRFINQKVETYWKLKQKFENNEIELPKFKVY